MARLLQILLTLTLIAVGVAAALECIDRIRVWKLSPPHERIGWTPPENGTSS
jgi:hypothetical protein